MKQSILTKFVSDLNQFGDDIAFEDAIKSLFERDVIKFDRTTQMNKSMLATLEAAAKETCTTIQSNPISRPRPNEVGNDIEKFLLDALIANNVDAGEPDTTQGKARTTGYPDLIIRRDKFTTIYLEVKSYSNSTQETSLRSFYFSPSKDPKVAHDAHHLVVGFEIQNEENNYWPVGFEIVDLFGLPCSIKAEVNSNNKHLYDASLILAKDSVPKVD